MSSVLTIDNREYHPAGQVGKRFGYTRDYILMLARDGKIDGKKIGHRWYVNEDSAKKFFESAENARIERKRLMSEERKAELRKRGTVSAHEAKKKSYLVEGVAISLLSLIALGAGFVSTYAPETQLAQVHASDSSFFSRVAETVYGWFSGDAVQESAVIEEPERISPEYTHTSVPLHEPTTATRTVHTSLVISPDEMMTVTDVEVIRDSFSDEVSVSIDPEHPDTGIIVPHFKNGDGEAYRFLMVPVDEDDTP